MAEKVGRGWSRQGLRCHSKEVGLHLLVIEGSKEGRDITRLVLQRGPLASAWKIGDCKPVQTRHAQRGVWKTAGVWEQVYAPVAGYLLLLSWGTVHGVNCIPVLSTRQQSGPLPHLLPGPCRKDFRPLQYPLLDSS